MKKCFLVVTHYHDAKGSGTEEVEICSYLKDKHLTSANIIIDVMKMEYVKNRLDGVEGVTQEQMTDSMVYYIQQHKQEITALLRK